MGGKRRIRYKICSHAELNPYLHAQPKRRATSIEISGLDDVASADLGSRFGRVIAVPSHALTTMLIQADS